MLYKNKIKGPVLIPFSVVFILGLGLILYVGFTHEQEERLHELEKDERSVEGLFNLQLDNVASRLHASLCPISRDSSLKNAYLNGDFDKMKREVDILYKRLHEKHRVTHFYIHDATRHVVLRAHYPELKGDLINRTTLLEAERTRSESQGVEFGHFGSLTMRAIKPWFKNGKLIGYLEAGEELSRVAEEVHNALGVDLVALTNRNMSKQPDKVKYDFDPLSPQIIYNSLGEHKTGLILRELKSKGTQGEAAVQVVDGKHELYGAQFPLLDAAQNQVGDIVVVRDVSALQQAFKASLLKTSLFILIGGGVIFLFLYIILDRVEKEYSRQLEIEAQFVNLSSEHQRIVQVEKLSEIGRTISEIAHQINNPLVGVVNLAQLAEREADNPQRVRELLGEIRQAGQDSHTFLERMLEFTRVSRSEVKPTDLCQLMEETISLFQQSTEKHPKVITDFPTQSPVISVDPILVRHALYNLLANADEFSPPDGEINVILKTHTNKLGVSGWAIQVIDHGPGLTDAVQNKLFTPFFTTHPKGTGLGLSVVQQVAILHGGTASGSNHPDGGAVFAIWLPKNPKKLGS
jgi:signal transduction histidine kinase